MSNNDLNHSGKPGTARAVDGSESRSARDADGDAAYCDQTPEPSADDYKVGKCRPPKHSQFRRGGPSGCRWGRGGNPATRAKREEAKRQKAAALETSYIERVMEAKGKFALDGKETEMTFVEALFRKRLADAAMGNVRERAAVLRQYDQIKRMKRTPGKVMSSDPDMTIQVLPAEMGIYQQPTPDEAD